jgi:hypothetical protein
MGSASALIAFRPLRARFVCLARRRARKTSRRGRIRDGLRRSIDCCDAARIAVPLTCPSSERRQACPCRQLAACCSWGRRRRSSSAVPSEESPLKIVPAVRRAITPAQKVLHGWRDDRNLAQRRQGRFDRRSFPTVHATSSKLFEIRKAAVTRPGGFHLVGSRKKTRLFAGFIASLVPGGGDFDG